MRGSSNTWEKSEGQGLSQVRVCSIAHAVYSTHTLELKHICYSLLIILCKMGYSFFFLSFPIMNWWIFPISDESMGMDAAFIQ